MKKTKTRYVVCLRAEGAEDLEIYRVLPDAAASARGHVRVVDEPGEDYLYPKDWFAAVEVSEDADRSSS